jgi:hypothetical protein
LIPYSQRRKNMKADVLPTSTALMANRTPFAFPQLNHITPHLLPQILFSMACTLNLLAQTLVSPPQAHRSPSSEIMA